MKVLIIDDQYINRYLLEKLLTGYGFEVVSAEDGLDALDKMKTNDIDLIISDILLPRMDGFQLCREIKTNPEYMHIPFVFYTAAYTEKKDQEFAESLGADRFILKPTDPVEFISIIRVLLNNYPQLSDKSPQLLKIEDEQYLTEHNQRLIRQLEKKLSELEEVNRNLQRSEERYKNLFENANDAIILYEISPAGELGEISEVNEVACKRLGYTREELIGKKISIIDSPRFKDRYSVILADLGTFGHLTFEGENQTRDGEPIPVEISAHLYYENGNRYCLSIYRDITSRKKAMAELGRAVLQINDNIYQMATIGDKIRNPLSIILSISEECHGLGSEQMTDAIRQIDDFVTQLDKGWVDSEKVRSFLIKNYGIRMDGFASADT